MYRALVPKITSPVQLVLLALLMGPEQEMHGGQIYRLMRAGALRAQRLLDAARTLPSGIAPLCLRAVGTDAP